MNDASEQYLREVALQYANHAPRGTPDDVVQRAEAYLKFMKGDEKTNEKP